jgi:hypothetical protein
VSASRRDWTVRDLLDLRETALGGYVATCLGSQYETGEKNRDSAVGVIICSSNIWQGSSSIV